MKKLTLKISEYVFFISIVTFNTLFLVFLSFTIGVSGILFIVLWIQSGHELNHIAGSLILLLPFLPAMIVPAKISEKIPNLLDFLDRY